MWVKDTEVNNNKSFASKALTQVGTEDHNHSVDSNGRITKIKSEIYQAKDENYTFDKKEKC